jgi:hypothetical protein
MVILRLVLVVAIFIAANVLTFATPSSMAAVRVGGEAYGLAVGSPAVGVPGAAYVQLPAEGGSVSDTSPGAGYGTGNAVGSTAKITTSSQGDLGSGTVTSTTTVADGELLGGVVRAHDIRIVASVSGGHPSAQVTFGTLLVAGIAYNNPQPNTRVDIPGVGYVILNEQLIGGDGRDVAAIIVRAARLQITEPSLFDMQRGTDLILAHAAAGVPDVIATRPVAAGPLPTATTVPWAPISAYRPVDTSISNGNGDDDNFHFDNSNSNNNVAAVATSATRTTGTTTGTPATSTPIKVIIVICTPTNTPTPTMTPTPSPTNTPTPTSC